MKFLMYGFDACSDCREAKAKFEELGISYQYMNIGDSVANMRRFLKLRDTEAMFEEVRQEGRIGIPLFVMSDKTMTFDLEEVIAKADK